MNRRALLLITVLITAFLAALSIDFARAAPPYNTDVGHYLWSSRGNRTIYKCNCPPPATSTQGFCTCYGSFNPNVAIGFGLDGNLNALRYGISPFSGADSPSRGRIKGENWSLGVNSPTYRLLRALIAAPSNPLNLPPNYGPPTMQDMSDIAYVTMDNSGPAADTLEAMRVRLAATVPASCPACPTCRPCPTCPTSTPCPLPITITKPQKVCVCPPPPGAFDPSTASTGRIEIILSPPQTNGACPPCLH